MCEHVCEHVREHACEHAPFEACQDVAIFHIIPVSQNMLKFRHVHS